jgi:hypothetical protein
LNAADFIRKIETTYDVTSLKVNNIEVWPFLRNKYYFTFRDLHDFNLDQETTLDLGKISKVLKNMFYGLINLFKKYDCLILSNLAERRLINYKYANIKLNSLISMLGKEKVLLIENPADNYHYKLNSVSNKNIISSNLFLFLSYFLLFFKKMNIENEKILKNINKNYNIEVDYHKLVSRFFSYVILFNVFFRIYKIKKIFVTQYYSLFHQAAIYSFNKLEINTIELQHGIINNEHSAYNILIKLNKLFFPKYLLVFGDNVKDVFKKNNYFINYDNVISIGYMYIDYINNQYKKSKDTINLFKNFRKKYNKIVAVSSQLTIDDKLIEFIKKTALLNNNILYIFIPRNILKDYSNRNLPDNVIFIKNLNVYQIIIESDFHSTVYSTCALEAPALGVPNILINIDDMAKKYYLDVLTNSDVTRFVDTEDTFLNTILTWNTKNNREIMEMHDNFYEKNHKESLKNALKIM